MDLPAIHSRLDGLSLASSGLLAVLGTILSVTTLTYIISTTQGAATVRNKRHGSRPPKLPYAIPLLGHLPEFLSDTLKFLAKATYVYCCVNAQQNGCTKLNAVLNMDCPLRSEYSFSIGI